MKKLVFITDSGFWSHGTDIVKELNRRYKLTLFINYVSGFKNHSQSDIIRFCSKNGIKLFLNVKALRSRSIFNIVEGYKKYIKKIRNINPDLIYVESFGNPYLALLFRLFFGNKKVTIGIHDFELHNYDKNTKSVSSIVSRFVLLTCFNNFHFFSKSQKKAFDLTYDSKNSFFARMPSIELSTAPSNRGKKSSKSTFLYFGRIYHYKGLDVLLKASKILNKKKVNFKLVIAGYCPDFKVYQKLASGQDNLELIIKPIPNHQVPKLFNSSDFAVFPYRAVTQSGPLILSYNYDVIPIASNLDGFKEYIEDGVTGFLFNNEDAESLAEKMENALNLSGKEISDLIRKKNKFRVDEFDTVKIADKYEAFFEEMS